MFPSQFHILQQLLSMSEGDHRFLVVFLLREFCYFKFSSPSPDWSESSFVCHLYPNILTDEPSELALVQGSALLLTINLFWNHLNILKIPNVWSNQIINLFLFGLCEKNPIVHFLVRFWRPLACSNSDWCLQSLARISTFHPRILVFSWVWTLQSTALKKSGLLAELLFPEME